MTANTFCRALFAFNPANEDYRSIRLSTEQEKEMLDQLAENSKLIFPDLLASTKATK